jgi:outer membrane protein OmpA-like peptidoglycan-associated protein
MRRILFCLLLPLVLGYQSLYGQCDYITPPAVKKITFASREVTFSNVTMNGKETTYLAVKKGETVKIKAIVEAKKTGDYCPDCIVQIYWGIRGYTSVCAKSFHGYQFSKKKSSLKFSAPMEDGYYYITMGSTLDYSCKNNIYRPSCSPDAAFAVLKVGNPDPEKKITLTKAKKGGTTFLKTTLLKQGCFGNLDKIEWYFDDKKLAYDNQEEIQLTKLGTYKVIWSNCLGSVADSIMHSSDDIKVTSLSFVQGASAAEKTEIEVLLENNDNFVLKNLIFDLGKSEIRPEAQKDLDKLSEVMKNNPAMRILLEGHTDVRGAAKKNLLLSEQRVQSTKDYLVKQGVRDSNIETKGWGHQKPLLITKDVEKGKINRRVEVSVLSR